MRHRRGSLSPAEIESATRRITARVAPLVADAARIGLFSAVRGEARVDAGTLATEGRLLAWPISDPHTRAMVFHASIDPPTEAGTYGIPEPSPSFPIDPETFDAIVVPGLAFGRHGGRLGQGSGFYDRFLPRLRADALRIGVCYEWQVLDTVPLEPHDVPMTHVVTETEIVITGR